MGLRSHVTERGFATLLAILGHKISKIWGTIPKQKSSNILINNISPRNEAPAAGANKNKGLGQIAAKPFFFRGTPGEQASRACQPGSLALGVQVISTSPQRAGQDHLGISPDSPPRAGQPLALQRRLRCLLPQLREQ